MKCTFNIAKKKECKGFLDVYIKVNGEYLVLGVNLVGDFFRM